MEFSRPFFVLNPGGRDPDQDFPDGAGSPERVGHPPVNFHAYAACMRGGFRKRLAAIPRGSAVLLLLRARHLSGATACARRLREKGCRVFVSWKEAGWFQVQEALAAPGRWASLCKLAKFSDGALCPVPELAPLFQAAGFSHSVFLPTPYPLEEPAWDFSIPLAQREGIFIGTRELRQPRRGHRAALAIAATLKAPVTVVNTEGPWGAQMIREIAPQARIISGPLPYPSYLRAMAKARVVFQLDGSRVPGQVAGDALLCGMPCAGGDSAIERLAFPTLASWGREAGEMPSLLKTLLEDDASWEQIARDSRKRALANASFSHAQSVMARLIA